MMFPNMFFELYKLAFHAATITSETQVKTSTPNVSRQLEMTETGQSPDVSVILMEKSTSAPILISDDSINKTEDKLVNDCGHTSVKSSLAKLEETFIKQCTHSVAGHCKKCVRIKIPEEVEELFFKGGKSSNHECSAGVDPARVYEVIGMLLKDLGPYYKLKSTIKTNIVLYKSDNVI